MKKTKKRKLALHTETVRHLSDRTLQMARGAMNMPPLPSWAPDDSCESMVDCGGLATLYGRGCL